MNDRSEFLDVIAHMVMGCLFIAIMGALIGFVMWTIGTGQILLLSIVSILASWWAIRRTNWL